MPRKRLSRETKVCADNNWCLPMAIAIKRKKWVEIAAFGLASWLGFSSLPVWSQGQGSDVDMARKLLEQAKSGMIREGINESSYVRSVGLVNDGRVESDWTVYVSRMEFTDRAIAAEAIEYSRDLSLPVEYSGSYSVNGRSNAHIENMAQRVAGQLKDYFGTLDNIHLVDLNRNTSDYDNYSRQSFTAYREDATRLISHFTLVAGKPRKKPLRFWIEEPGHFAYVSSVRTVQGRVLVENYCDDGEPLSMSWSAEIDASELRSSRYAATYFREVVFAAGLEAIKDKLAHIFARCHDKSLRAVATQTGFSLPLGSAAGLVAGDRFLLIARPRLGESVGLMEAAELTSIAEIEKLGRHSSLLSVYVGSRNLRAGLEFDAKLLRSL